MSNSFPLELENISSSSAKCCIFYPTEAKNFQSLFEDILLPHLEKTFHLDYVRLPYDLIDKKFIQIFKNECQNSTILIFAYHNSITIELSYKLGIAHAYGVRIVLINLQKTIFFKPPDCINYDFLIQYLNLQDVKDIESFLDGINDIIISCLSENVIDFLYKKAINLCMNLEKNSSRIVCKVDKITFAKRLSLSDISCCLENHSESTSMLLRTVVEDVRILSLTYLNEEEFNNKESENLSTVSIINEIVNKKVVSNHTNNNQGASIGNFANAVKDNAHQQANQHNDIAQSQSFTDTAKEIQELLDRISTTDQINNPVLIATKAIEEIEKNPTLKERIINAGKEAEFAAINAAVDHPAIKIVTAAIKGAIEA
jgi:hypothetical protein